MILTDWSVFEMVIVIDHGDKCDDVFYKKKITIFFNKDNLQHSKKQTESFAYHFSIMIIKCSILTEKKIIYS